MSEPGPIRRYHPLLGSFDLVTQSLNTILLFPDCSVLSVPDFVFWYGHLVSRLHILILASSFSIVLVPYSCFLYSCQSCVGTRHLFHYLFYPLLIFLNLFVPFSVSGFCVFYYWPLVSGFRILLLCCTRFYILCSSVMLASFFLDSVFLYFHFVFRSLF